MEVNVKQHPDLGKCGHIESINLVYKGTDVIILDINLHTKYKSVSAYGGATDSDVQSLWIGMDEVQLSLPEQFKHNVIFSEAQRYSIHVCIYRYEVLEDMVTFGEAAILWESS